MIKIPTVTFVFFENCKVIFQASSYPDKVQNPHPRSQCLSHWISISLAIKHEWKKWSSSLLSSVFALSVSFRHAALCYLLPANSNTSKILGVSIPYCACVTKHKTNICCRGKIKHGGPFQRLVGHFHTGSLSAGGQHCQSPALPLSFLSYFPVEAMLFLSGV